MLRNLKIENVAIIQSADIDFGNGLNVLTGETGAGKSIIIDSINAVLGERTSKDLIRTNAEKATVFAVFDEIPNTVKSYLKEQDIEFDDELLIQRTITQQGKTTCKINGYPVNTAMLKNIADSLINIHGQHDSQALLSPENHYKFVDMLSDDDILISQYRTTYLKVVEYKHELEKLNADEYERERQTELLDFQIKELEEADIKVGEIEELQKKSDYYKNAEKIKQSLSAALNLLDCKDNSFTSKSIVSDMTEATREVENASEIFSDVSELSVKLNNLTYEIKDCADELMSKIDSVELDALDREAVEEKLDLLHSLSRKYGGSEEQMLSFLKDAKEKRKTISNSDARSAELETLLTQEYEKCKYLAEKLSLRRKETAEVFSKKVTEELAFLDMPNVKFTVNFEKSKMNINGKDNIEFLISPNKGESLRPLAKIASGGELSRTMLAIKSVLSKKDSIPTLIFDEIDSGVSGRAADKIGEKLSSVAIGRQVICITHLAQIASKADVHFLIEKNTVKDNTFTKITPLDYEGKVNELARIMSGGAITENQKTAAKELLNKKGI